VREPKPWIYPVQEFRLTAKCSQDLRSVFDPVVHKIVGLVSSQAAAARRERPSKPVSVSNSMKMLVRTLNVIQHVVLVGGFGESMYLYKKLKAWANTQVPTLSICNPTDS
jgi:hypothetical protein